MSTLPIERFLPAINHFTLCVKKAYAAKGIVVLLFGFMLILGVFGFLFSSDFVVAISVACIVLLAFLFYLLHMYIQEATVKQALATKDRIDEIIATEAFAKLAICEVPAKGRASISTKPMVVTMGEERSELRTSPTSLSAVASFAKASKDGLEAGERAELYARLALSIRPLSANLVHAPAWLAFLVTPCNRLIGYVAWQPLHILSEVLFLSAINQHISRIKTAPTNLQYHACLANCYVMLANHYQEPIKTRPLMAWPGILLTPRTRLILETKGRASSTSAIEELTILSSFAPDQLWVHNQLAISYRELEMPEREIEECETIIRLCPDDHASLLRLGTLYFRQGKNAKGLEVYERLKPIQPLLAEELISHYGAYKPLLEAAPILS